MHLSFVKHHKVSKCKVLQVGWDEGIERSPAGERFGCTFRGEIDPEPTTHTHSPESQPCPGLHAKEQPACPGRWSWPSLLLWHPSWIPASSSGVPSRANTWICWSGVSVGPQTGSVGWKSSWGRQAETAGIFQPGEGKALGRSYCSLSIFKGGL